MARITFLVLAALSFSGSTIESNDQLTLKMGDPKGDELVLKMGDPKGDELALKMGDPKGDEIA